MSCVFCRIAAGEIPANRVLENEQVVAFHDLNPQAPVHVLVIPRAHLVSTAAAGPQDEETLGALLLACAEVARTCNLEHGGYRIVLNHGPDAGQSVFHLHAHVLGGRRMGWPPG